MSTTVPAHVPPDRVRDFDFLKMVGETDVHSWFKQLHDGPDFFYTPRQGGHWVATRYADMEAILVNNEDFSSEHSSLPREGKPFRVTLLESDEPIHTEFRRIVAPFLAPKVIGDLERKARHTTIELIEGFKAKGECDFVNDFALRMPIGIFMGLVDLPDTDREYLIGIAVDLVRGQPEQQTSAFQRAAQYMGQKYAERGANPGSDILSALVQAKVDGGRPLDQMELLGIGVLLLAGGLDTVAALLSFSMNFLARSPDHRRQILDNPERIPDIAEELMRRFHVVNIARIAVRDMEFRGVQLKAGDAILIPTVAAGIDDQQYPDPMKVDFERSNKRSLIFGRGKHQCVGMFLARAELKVFLEEWFKRIPDFQIKPGEQPVFVPGRASAGLYLPLVWNLD